jgi:hypothetical protein
MPAESKFPIQSLQPGIKDPMHDLDYGLLAGSTIARAESARPTPATMENLLSKALATTKPNEICCSSGICHAKRVQLGSIWY